MPTFESNPGFDYIKLFGFLTSTSESGDRPAGVDINDYVDLCDLLTPTITASAIGAGSPSALISQSESGDECYTTNAANSWFKADFGSGVQIVPSQIALRNRNSGDHSPMDFLVEGSNDDVTYTPLRQVNTADMTYFWVGSAWGEWWIETASAYRYIRITQTGLNNSGNNIFLLGEMQLFGDQPT